MLEKIGAFVKRRKGLTVLFITLLAVVIAGTMTVKNASAKRARAIGDPVTEGIVEKGDLTMTVEGTGALENDSSDEVYITDGLQIDEVLVKTGDAVKAGDILATVNETSLKAELYTTKEALDEVQGDIEDVDRDTGTYYQLQLKKDNLEEKYAVLQDIEEHGAVASPSDGIITNVNIGDDTSAADTTSTDTTTGNDTVFSGFFSMNSGEETDYKVVKLGQAADEQEAAAKEITDLSALAAIQPVAGAKAQTEIKTDAYTGTVVWKESAAIFAEGTAYAAVVTLEAGSDHVFALEKITSIPISGTFGAWTLTEEGTVFTFDYIFAKTAETEKNTGQGQNPEYPSGEGDQSAGTGSYGDKSGVTGGDVSAYSSTGGFDMTSGTGIDEYTGATDTGSTSAGNTNEELVTAFMMSSGDTMSLRVEVDELDILSVTEGQKVLLNLDAIEHKEFEGKITGINTNGTSNSGVTKYEVEITVSKQTSMMAGMNANVSIITEEKTGVLMIPAGAAGEEGGSRFVYTDKGGDGLELSGEQEIKTGISDGLYTEVTEGLAEGEVFYYIADDETDDMMFPFGF